MLTFKLQLQDLLTYFGIELDGTSELASMKYCFDTGRLYGMLQLLHIPLKNVRLQNSNNRSVIISVSKVIVSVDFSVAKVYISVFPSENSAIILKEVNSSSKKLKHEVSQKTKKQLRKVPDLIFYIDDSLDYIDEIENSLKGLNNPIK